MRRLIATVLIVIGSPIAIGSALATPADTVDRATVAGPGTRVVVAGCEYEDSCTIDYRGNRNGRGIWVIRGIVP